MKNLLLKISLVAAVLTGNVLVLTPAYAAINCNAPANSKEQIQCGACQANGTLDNCQPGGASKSLSDTIATVINILSVFGGVLAVIMLIVGGFRYIVSSGSSEATKSARNTILYALIGLVVIATAQLIVHFVINGVQDCPNGKTATGQCK